MILSRKPVMLAEVKTLTKDLEENEILYLYLKKFAKLSKDKAEACANEIRKLNNHKINEEHIIKLVDFLPEDIPDINKIFNELNITEEEANALLAIIKKY